MNIFITGGAGFIGSHTAEHFLREGHSVIVIDAFNFGYDPAIKEYNVGLLSKHEKNFTFIEVIFGTESY